MKASSDVPKSCLGEILVEIVVRDGAYPVPFGSQSDGSDFPCEGLVPYSFGTWLISIDFALINVDKVETLFTDILT